MRCSGFSVTFFAEFTIKCGYYPGAKCKCTDYEIIKYRGKISGLIMDRIDIQKEVHPVDFFAIADQKSGASSEELRTKVEKARKIQQERYAQEKGLLLSEYPPGTPPSRYTSPEETA